MHEGLTIQCWKQEYVDYVGAPVPDSEWMYVYKFIYNLYVPLC